jgi:site-specific DNA-adenine methylase
VPDLFRSFHVERWQHMSSVGGGPGSGPRKTVTLIATNYRLNKAQPEVQQMPLPNVEPMQKTIWGSPAGKKRLAARLVKLIPPHEVYVEPFAGSAAVFFEKEPCATEVLGDADPEIAFAFKALKTITDEELSALRKKDWVGHERTFKGLIEARPRSKVEKLYRFLYLSHFSYGKLRGKSFNPNADGVEATTIERIERHRERLRKVQVRRAHYAELVKEFDGKGTFFYLDPPYPGHNVEIGEDTFDEAEFRKVLEGIKGRFLVTYGTRGELDTSGFHVRKIRPPRTIRAMRGVGGPMTLPTLLIANYGITEKTLGAPGDLWVLDEVQAQVALPPDLADDLERARVLAKALAETRDDGPLVELARELDRVESSPGEREAVLAADLLPIAGDLAAVLSEVPGVGAALAEAAPVLEEVAKAQWSRAFINDLPDDAFLYVEPGGEKDEGGRTVPRSLRHFPVRNQRGEIDLPHLRNALARLPQSDLPAGVKERAQAEARRLLEEAQSEVEKAKRVPFQQWGGSAQYSKRLAERLPEHKRYVEPFCGSAAVFYAKAPAAEEVLADADADVVFAHRYLQKLDAKSHAALKRMNWRVSRTGFERARACEPSSDAERFWKIAYGRLCSWGAKQDMGGFSTVNDGKTYNLDDLSKFSDRVRNARLVKQDWKKTLADFDGAGTLFFIDPPYAEEWAIDDGIPPEEVADAVSKLKGDFVVAYTDSARARKALKKVGQLFTMKVSEGRGAGLWQKRSRLFVASCKLRKADDLEWLEDATLAPSSPLMAALAKPIQLLKTDEERFVLGVVLEPETVDAQKDIYSAAEVREAAHRFMEEYQNVGLMHRQLVNDRVKILESYVAPVDLEVGGGHVKKGAWLLAVRVEDDDLWKQVKDGTLSGYSIGGNAIRTAAGA